MITLLALTWTAAADIPPPPGEHWIETDVVVTEAPADHTLVIYPWSSSNGAPTAELRVVEPGKNVSFGRRISGTPVLYVVPNAAWNASSYSKMMPMDDMVDDKTVAFLEKEGMRCGWSYVPTMMGPTSKPSQNVQQVTVAIDNGNCVTGARDPEPAPKPDTAPQPQGVPLDAKPADAGSPPEPTPAPSPKGSDAGCAVVPATAPLALLLPALLLGLRRRR